MHKEVEKYLSLKRKLIVLEYARVFGSNLEAFDGKTPYEVLHLINFRF